MPVIDVHTHMFTARWLELLQKEGGIYSIKVRPDGQREIFRGDTPVVLPQKGHFDYGLRIQHMDAAGIDISIVSLTCPNVYWGNEDDQLPRRARVERHDGRGAVDVSRPHPLVHVAALGVPAARGRGARAHLRQRRGRRDGARQHRRDAA